MPTYEYRCQKCKKLFDRFQLITSEPIRTHPKCGGRVKRLMGGGSGFLFKGSGFYITDYRGKGYHDAKKKDTPSPTSTDTPSSSSKDKPSSSSKDKPSSSSSDSSSSKKKSSDPAS